MIEQELKSLAIDFNKISINLRKWFNVSVEHIGNNKTPFDYMGHMIHTTYFCEDLCSVEECFNKCSDIFSSDTMRESVKRIGFESGEVINKSMEYETAVAMLYFGLDYLYQYKKRVEVFDGEEEAICIFILKQSVKYIHDKEGNKHKECEAIESLIDKTLDRLCNIYCSAGRIGLSFDEEYYLKHEKEFEEYQGYWELFLEKLPQLIKKGIKGSNNELKLDNRITSKAAEHFIQVFNKLWCGETDGLGKRYIKNVISGYIDEVYACGHKDGDWIIEIKDINSFRKYINNLKPLNENIDKELEQSKPKDAHNLNENDLLEAQILNCTEKRKSDIVKSWINEATDKIYDRVEYKRGRSHLIEGYLVSKDDNPFGRISGTNGNNPALYRLHPNINLPTAVAYVNRIYYRAFVKSLLRACAENSQIKHELTKYTKSFDCLFQTIPLVLLETQKRLPEKSYSTKAGGGLSFKAMDEILESIRKFVVFPEKNVREILKESGVQEHKIGTIDNILKTWAYEDIYHLSRLSEAMNTAIEMMTDIRKIQPRKEGYRQLLNDTINDNSIMKLCALITQIPFGVKYENMESDFKLIKDALIKVLEIPQKAVSRYIGFLSTIYPMYQLIIARLLYFDKNGEIKKSDEICNIVKNLSNMLIDNYQQEVIINSSVSAEKEYKVAKQRNQGKNGRDLRFYKFGTSDKEKFNKTYLDEDIARLLLSQKNTIYTMGIAEYIQKHCEGFVRSWRTDKTYDVYIGETIAESMYNLLASGDIVLPIEDIVRNRTEDLIKELYGPTRMNTENANTTKLD